MTTIALELHKFTEQTAQVHEQFFVQIEKGFRSRNQNKIGLRHLFNLSAMQ